MRTPRLLAPAAALLWAALSAGCMQVDDGSSHHMDSGLALPLVFLGLLLIVGTVLFVVNLSGSALLPPPPPPPTWQPVEPPAEPNWFQGDAPAGPPAAKPPPAPKKASAPRSPPAAKARRRQP